MPLGCFVIKINFDVQLVILALLISRNSSLGCGLLVACFRALGHGYTRVLDLGVDRSENSLLHKYIRMQGGLTGDCFMASSKYY